MARIAPLKTPTNISKVMHMKLLDAAGREITPHFPREKTVLLYSCLKTAFHPTTPSPLLDTYLTERLEQILSQALREGNRFFISPASMALNEKPWNWWGRKKKLTRILKSTGSIPVTWPSANQKGTCFRGNTAASAASREQTSRINIRIFSAILQGRRLFLPPLGFIASHAFARKLNSVGFA